MLPNACIANTGLSATAELLVEFLVSWHSIFIGWLAGEIQLEEVG